MPPKYKPGGKRFPPRLSSKPLPKQVLNDDRSTSSSPSVSTEATSRFEEEAENQFELELCWCIQQLQISLNSGKLVEKQMVDATKTINLLKNNTIAIIRKRQLMRNTFGDYRTKMAQDEKKHGNYVSSVKFSTPKTKTKKSVFLKKATAGLGQQETPDESNNGTIDAEKSTKKKSFVMSNDPSDVPFTFNFSEPESK